jgi:hypothetical protein
LRLERGGRGFAEHVGGLAEPEEYFEGSDDEGFSGAGLTGEAVEAGMEFHGDVVDDGEVLDVEFSKQGRPPCRGAG